MLTLYRILSFLLVPVALFFGTLCCIVLVVALSQPALLLPLFIIACVCIYTYCSIRFVMVGIDQNRILGPKLGDWLRVNSYVSIVFALLNITQLFLVAKNPSVLEMQVEAMPAYSAGGTVDKAFLVQLVKGCLYFLFAYSIVLLVHVFVTYAMMKKYAFVFFTRNPE
ncbi:MAG: hypothetical protein EAY72_03140 [Bacteroidetes bacterium]|jgi:hypothetical protein|nr:MAG: hypothetical protein EAY72_03140 [Bacteroidota bacterium]